MRPPLGNTAGRRQLAHGFECVKSRFRAHEGALEVSVWSLVGAGGARTAENCQLS